MSEDWSLGGKRAAAANSASGSAAGDAERRLDGVAIEQLEHPPAADVPGVVSAEFQTETPPEFRVVGKVGSPR